MAATLVPRKAEIDAAQAARDAALASVDARGELWEEAEVYRLVSAGHAEAADRARADYDEARKTLARHDMALQANVRAFNDDTDRYNSLCTVQD